MRAVLDQMGLSGQFWADVAFEDGMETMAQRYLSAAMKLNRPPNKCVVFDSSPKVGSCSEFCV